MDKSVYEFDNYKSYLLDQMGSKKVRRGIKTAIASHIGCKPAHISQALHGKSHFSLEQAHLLNSYFNHTEGESDYFILLVLKARAGNKGLRIYFQNKIDYVQKQRLILSERITNHGILTNEQKSTYYSSWHYCAIHMALTVFKLQTLEALCAYFKLDRKKVIEVLEFLESIGLIQKNQNRYEAGTQNIYLKNESALIGMHHTNWRLQAIDSLQSEDLGDLHYSGVITLSVSDALKIKNKLLEVLEENLKRVKESPSETVYCYSMDLFELQK